MRDRTDNTTAFGPVEPLIDHRRIVVAVVFLMILGVSAGVGSLEESAGLEGFELGTEKEAKLEYVQENFSTPTEDREIVQIVVEDGNVFAKETLVETLELQQQIRANGTVSPTLADDQPTVGVANVVATAAIRFRNPTRTDPSLERQIATLESLDQSQIDAIVGEVLGEGRSPASEAFLFVPNDYDRGSTTASSTMVVVFQTTDEQFPVTAAPDRFVDSQRAIEAIASDVGQETTVVGSGVLTDEQQRALGDTMSLVGPLALFLVVGILAVAYRDVVDVVLGLSGIVLVQLWTFGTLGWLGMAFNPVLIAIPVLLIGLSIDYGIHVFMRYREHLADDAAVAGSDGEVSLDAAMKAGLAGVGVALVWVTLTTAIGFLSNLTSPVGPIQELGLIAAIGIVGSFVVFVLFLPPLKVEIDGLLQRVGFDRHRRPIGTGDSATGRVLAVGARAARKAPVAVVVLTLLVTALTAVAAVNVSTSWGPEDNMVDGAPDWTDNLPGSMQPGEYGAREDLRFVNDNYVRHGSRVEILVEGDVTDPSTLERVAGARHVAGEQGTAVLLASGHPNSEDPLTTMREVAENDETFSESYAAADDDGDGVPDRNIEALYEELFATAPEKAAEVLHREDGEYLAYRMAVSVDAEADGGQITDQFETVGKQLDADGTSVTATGQPIVGQLIQDHLLETLLRSLFVTLFAVVLILMIVFRTVHGSATLGAVTVFPVVFAVSWIVGTMYVLGYPLSVLNAIIASLTIGIGIDYSIHVSERFRSELDGSTPIGEAITRTVSGTGGALLGSAATTAVGFGVLAFAIHPPLQQFGTITAIMIGYAFLGSVLVLPSFLVLWARYRGVDAGTTVDESVAPGTHEST